MVKGDKCKEKFDDSRSKWSNSKKTGQCALLEMCRICCCIIVHELKSTGDYM